MKRTIQRLHRYYLDGLARHACEPLGSSDCVGGLLGAAISRLVEGGFYAVRMSLPGPRRLTRQTGAGSAFWGAPAVARPCSAFDECSVDFATDLAFTASEMALEKAVAAESTTLSGGWP